MTENELPKTLTKEQVEQLKVSSTNQNSEFNITSQSNKFDIEKVKAQIEQMQELEAKRNILRTSKKVKSRRAKNKIAKKSRKLNRK